MQNKKMSGGLKILLGGQKKNTFPRKCHMANMSNGGLHGQS